MTLKDTPVQIGRYQVEGLLGRGGMGAVYAARDPLIDRHVAIKLVSESFRDPRARERLANEARAAGQLHHPNIVTIFDVGEHEGQTFIVMERVHGAPLSSLLDGKPPGIALATGIALIEEACAGLAYAHEKGIIHLDVKPDNLMVDADGHVKILDFGIAKVGGDDATRTASVIGSLRYMAPEQLVPGAQVDRRCDVFSIGCVLYELVAGTPAFEGGIQDAVARAMGGDPRPLRDVVPNVDPALSDLVARLMARDPANRPSDLAAVARQLAAIRTTPMADAAPAPAPPANVPSLSSEQMSTARTPVARGRRRRRRGLRIAAIVLTAAVARGLWKSDRETRTSAPDPSLGPSGTVVGPSGTAGQLETVIPGRLRPEEPAPAGAPAATATPPDPQRFANEVRGPDSGRQPGARPEPAPPEPTPPAEPPNAQRPFVPRGGRGVPDNGVMIPGRGRGAMTRPVQRAPLARTPLFPPGSEEQKVVATLQRYRLAIEQGRLEVLNEVYPSLPPAQRDRIERELAGASRYQLDVSDVSVQVQGDAASVDAVVTRTVVPRAGRTQRTRTPTSFHLKKRAEQWLIEGITAR